MDDFSSNREGHYRRQLIALQNDMNLITHADPYMPEPMEDSPDEIARIFRTSCVWHAISFRDVCIGGQVVCRVRQRSQ